MSWPFFSGNVVPLVIKCSSVTLALMYEYWPWCTKVLKPVRTPVAILGSLGVCIYVPASRHWLISYSPIHLT